MLDRFEGLACFLASAATLTQPRPLRRTTPLAIGRSSPFASSSRGQLAFGRLSSASTVLHRMRSRARGSAPNCPKSRAREAADFLLCVYAPFCSSKCAHVCSRSNKRRTFVRFAGTQGLARNPTNKRRTFVPGPRTNDHTWCTFVPARLSTLLRRKRPSPTALPSARVSAGLPRNPRPNLSRISGACEIVHDPC